MEGMLLDDLPDITIEERRVRNFIQFVKRNGRDIGQGKCRRLQERLLELKHTTGPDLIVVQLLDDDGRLKGVLWVTSEQQRAFVDCGADIQIHDNTYNLDQLGYKLGVFSTICKEGHNVPVGQCFIIDEESSSYEWQLRSWLYAHGGLAPLVVITDADPVVVSVVALVFLLAHHIRCMYHLIANIFKNCKGDVGGAISQLVVDFITVSKTRSEEAFNARWVYSSTLSPAHSTCLQSTHLFHSVSLQYPSVASRTSVMCVFYNPSAYTPIINRQNGVYAL